MVQMATKFSKRQLLLALGKTAGAATMYQAMTTLGFAAQSNYKGAPNLAGAPKGTRVLILGAGLAGMVAAYELRKAGYTVKILEYNQRAGGRCWTIRGGDSYTELGGATQKCKFDPGLYINPGPWRIPYHHHAVLGYCKQFGIRLEPFIQVNYNALVHSTKAFGGKPQKYRDIQADFQGHTAELLSKAVNSGALDQQFSAQDREKLLDAMQHWGGLTQERAYRPSLESSLRRGFKVEPGGGLMPTHEFSTPMDHQELVDSKLWKRIVDGQELEFQSSIFQPAGGMDMIAKAFERETKGLVRYNAKVVRIHQDDKKVQVSFRNSDGTGAEQVETADWCVCTLPLSILSQIPLTASSSMLAAINAVPYEGSVKIGLQFKRRFWEQDEHIYGGISYTDTPIQKIAYPNTDYGKPGKGVLLGAYVWGANAFEFTAMSPAQRIRKAVEYGGHLHKQYAEEFDNGVAVGWHRVPWVHGCYGKWSDEARERHYKNLCQIDNRIVLAGEHASFIPAWMEGAVLSSLDAIERLHTMVVATTKSA
ncbi:flavin monoamine oxidase family protein [Verminephrobacter aporrectodeae subsp. tuberculatae]|uniref:flavin monoamine oxidase family protein n=1 Tax=Verminephrobacter aporrectodeae TaxID=1110389 RepID=UPI0022384CE5|nr:flavin monoamine oxidase family protein [Verminephrobacter aporrectodeae]MCW5222558.1 flavin monoamine oxidase family protein [Verminephrobacter aporrectodeae subsp. tuberculatae]MCW5257232.1 flavin monoamine oxidase family protein [Verminephrobacter aporrectodeae subsp. tuberculatae]MCW5288023.1 flavin monoamine oxidase family protein [Verminephrobacter aporrectodeae subsp. tuberculatae]MCW8196982.1 flavin monoamine oxidase family protein [Verminephrobacter aporrectodeae subsp. tuberculatae